MSFFTNQNLFQRNQSVIPQNPYDLPSDPDANSTNPYANPINPYSDFNDEHDEGQYYAQLQSQNLFPEAVAMPIHNSESSNSEYQSTQSETNSENNQHAPPIQYNPFEINYQEVTIDQWQQIPCRHTKYSQYWSTAESFYPETFSHNSQTEKQYNNFFWTIFFWLNFILTIFLLIYLIFLTKSDNNRQISIQIESIKMKDILISGSISLGIGIISNLIHYFYISCFPLSYLGIGMGIGFIYSIISSIIYLIYSKDAFVFILPFMYLIFLILFYCFSYKNIIFSSKFLQMSSRLLIEYPSIIWFSLYQVLLNLLIDSFFCILIFYVEKRGINQFVYLYVSFSYLWITLTFEYVEYLTVSGVASNWYFLYETDYFPDYPICRSYKRAMTTSFGSASISGLILSIFEFLEFIIDSANSSTEKACALSFFCCILQCIANCILCILKCCVMTINRFALVYCATFGIPFFSACKRVIELMVTRFVRVIMTACVIKEATRLNSFIYGISSALIGFAAGHIFFIGNSEYSDDTKLLFKIFTSSFTLLFTFGIFKSIVEPYVTLCDTILVCFSECPEILKTKAYDLFELIAENYKEGINSEISGKVSQNNQCSNYCSFMCCF